MTIFGNDTARLHVIRQDSRRTYDKINFIYKLFIRYPTGTGPYVPSVERPIQPYPENKNVNIYLEKKSPVVNISGGRSPFSALSPPEKF